MEIKQVIIISKVEETGTRVRAVFDAKGEFVTGSKEAMEHPPVEAVVRGAKGEALRSTFDEEGQPSNPEVAELLDGFFSRDDSAPAYSSAVVGPGSPSTGSGGPTALPGVSEEE